MDELKGMCAPCLDRVEQAVGKIEIPAPTDDAASASAAAAAEPSTATAFSDAASTTAAAATTSSSATTTTTSSTGSAGGAASIPAPIPAPNPASTVCAFCEGLLAPERIAALVAACRPAGDAPVDSFSVGIEVHNALLLKDRVLSAYLRSKCPLFDPRQLNTVKVVLRTAVIAAVAEQLQAKAVPYSTDGAVEFNVVTTNAATEGECAFLERLQSNPARRRRGVVSANSIRTALEQLSEAKLLKLARMPPAPPAAAAEFTVMTAHATIFLAGRYLKRARNVSQTPWFVGTKRMTELNVEDAIADHVRELFGPDSVRFCSAGREDADVRMLGEGRPFLLDVINPQRHMRPTEAELRQLQARINAGSAAVGVRDLQVVSREATSHFKQSGAERCKVYMALIWLDRPFTDEDYAKLNAIEELEVKQKTPVRVMKRRSLLVRDRTVHKAWARPVPGHPQFAKLFLATQAGFYIKEFVHSDCGRTMPSVRSLLGAEHADIVQLDVVGIHMDFPPRLPNGGHLPAEAQA